MTNPPQGNDDTSGDQSGDPDRHATRPVPSFEQPQQPYGRPSQPYGQPAQPDARPYGPPAQPYAPPQPYQPQPYQPQQPGYAPPAQPPPGPSPFGQPPQYGGAPYGAPGAPYGQPGAAPAPKSRVGLIAAVTGIILLVIAGVVVLVMALQSTVLDPAAVERDVAAQFEEREGVAIELSCEDEMTVDPGATYECTGVTADDEAVTLQIRIEDEDSAAYTWTEP